MVSAKSKRWMRHAIAIAILVGGGSYIYRAAKRRESRGNNSMLQIFDLRDALRSISVSFLSSHFRNMLISSIVLAWAGHHTLVKMVWLPEFIRKGYSSKFFVSFALLWQFYYRYSVCEKAKLWYQRTTWNTAIVERFNMRKFEPVIWAFNAHAQTVLCNSLNSLDIIMKPFPLYERQEIEAFDGNPIFLDWAQGCKEIDSSNPSAVFTMDSPIVLICHGIGGTAEDFYCRNLVSLCVDRGWRAVVATRWRLDYAESRDIEYAVNFLQRKFHRAPLLAVAYSAGGHVLLSYLQKAGHATPLVGAVVVSGALDLVRMIRFLNRSINTSYKLVMDRSIRNGVRGHLAVDRHAKKYANQLQDILQTIDHLGSHELYDKFLACLPQFSRTAQHSAHPAANERSTHYYYTCSKSAQVAFEDESIEPLPSSEYSCFGNDTASHYEQMAAYNLHKIGIPTLMLHAKDDPLMPPAFIKILRRAARTNRNVILAETNRGGHTAWHEGWYPTGPAWAENMAVEFFTALLQAHAHTAFTVDVVRRTLIAPMLHQRQHATLNKSVFRHVGGVETTAPVVTDSLRTCVKNCQSNPVMRIDLARRELDAKDSGALTTAQAETTTAMAFDYSPTELQEVRNGAPHSPQTNNSPHSPLVRGLFNSAVEQDLWQQSRPLTLSPDSSGHSNGKLDEFVSPANIARACSLSQLQYPGEQLQPSNRRNNKSLPVARCSDDMEDFIREQVA